MLDESQKCINMVIKNNFIRDYAPEGVTSWGIYLDNLCSNVTVQGNIVSGQGGKPAHIHGGKNNVITGNIFDNQNQLKEVLSYSSFNLTGEPMSGNVFSNNIILSRVNSAYTCYNNSISTDQFPQIQNNFYKNYGTAAISSSGKTGLADSNPVTGDPLMSGTTSYDMAPNSPVFASPVSFPVLVKGWGPAGYTIPANYGSTPSWISSSVTGVSISPASIFLSVGSQQLVFASVIPWNANNQTISSWSSSNPSVATVSSTGLVKGISAGTATITATSQEGSKTGACTVSVLAGVSNVVLYKSTTTSSINSSGLHIGSKAVDGDNSPNANSRWVSAVKPLFYSTGVFNPQWIEVDLGGSYSISAVKAFTGIGYDGLYSEPIGDFQFQRWDGSEWVDIINITGNRNPQYAKTFPAVTTNKVRLYVTFAMNEVRLFEMEVYGIPLNVSSFTIDDNNAYVINSVVTVNNSVVGTPTGYMISETPAFGSVWQPYASKFNYTLANTAEGSHTLYFKVKYDIGESPVVSQKFYLKAPHTKGNPSVPQGIISPNPISDIAKLKMVEVEGSSLTTAPSQEYEISFFSINGQLIYTGKYVGSEFDFDLSNAPSGNLLMKIQGREGCSTKLILKK
jgi:uncharacterized protein YjdB